MKNRLPRVSVIMPAYYSFETVESSLEALYAQTFRDFEIIMINSSPEERTQQIVSNGFPEVIFEQSPTRLLPHAARNRGVTLAQGELLVFTDPDCRARPDWIARLVEAHDSGYQVVGGSMELNTDRWFEQGVHLCKFSWLLSGLPPGSKWILPTANVCYSREVWEATGPLNGDLFMGDALLSWRARKSGYTLWFEPGAVVEHRHGENFASLLRQRLSRGREFAQIRTEFEGWSRLRATLHLILFPILVLLTLIRASRDAYGAGWGQRFILTLPVQFIGQLGWCLGEMEAHWNLATRGFVSRPDRRDSE